MSESASAISDVAAAEADATLAMALAAAEAMLGRLAQATRLFAASLPPVAAPALPPAAVAAAPVPPEWRTSPAVAAPDAKLSARPWSPPVPAAAPVVAAVRAAVTVPLNAAVQHVPVPPSLATTPTMPAREGASFAPAPGRAPAAPLPTWAAGAPPVSPPLVTAPATPPAAPALPVRAPAAPVARPALSPGARGGSVTPWPMQPAPMNEAAEPRMPDPAEHGDDLMRDDARLRRWLADELAHALARPQAGITGFDARLAPGWPGTMQGPWGWGG